MLKQSISDRKTPAYSVGDVVFWGTLTTAGEYTFIGHPKGDKAGKVLVLAHSGEIGFRCLPGTIAPNHEIGGKTAVKWG